MRSWKFLIPVFLICSGAFAVESRLPFSTVFKGQDQFNRLVAKAKSENWQALPIGERTAAVGLALVGTRYKHFTLEIDNRVESPSVNFQGMDCWTFFEIALSFARMLNEPELNRNFAAATSSELSGANGPGFTRHRTSASRSGRKMGVYISCTLLRPATTVASSLTRGYRNICIATGRTAEFWSRGRCVRRCLSRGIPRAISPARQRPRPRRCRALRAWRWRRNRDWPAECR